MTTTFFSLLALLLGVWLWQNSLQAREIAHRACRRACEHYGVQLLDDTVALEGLRLRRDDSGRVRVERRYVFEFTNTGASRQPGLVVVFGRRVEVLALDGGELFIP